MKYFLLLCLCGQMALFSDVFAGTDPKLSSDTLNFGKVQTKTVVSQKIIVSPADSRSLDLLDAHIVCKDNFFTVDSIDRMNHSLVIRFAPRHNIRHEAALFVHIRDGSAEYSLGAHLLGEGFYPDTTYNFTQNLSETNLVSALKTYELGHTSLGYNTARDYMFQEIDILAGDTLECIYSGKKIYSIGRIDAQNNGFNTEHTWPQSLGAQNDPQQCDLFHLGVTDATPNAKRGNYSYGNVVSGIQYTAGQSKLGNDAKGQVVFEPPPSYKGNVARGLFYFSVEYGNPYSFLTSQEAVLRQWCVQDTVDTKEMARNAGIAKHQNRRNPFIDHPEFIERIYRISDTANFPKFIAPEFSDSVSRLELQSVLRYNIPILLGNKGNDTARILSVNFGCSFPGYIRFCFNKTDSIISPGSFISFCLQRIPDFDGITAPLFDSCNMQITFVGGKSIESKVIGAKPSLAVKENTPQTNVSNLSNYPNPFGASTTLDFSVTNGFCQNFSLKIINEMGQEIADITEKAVWSGGHCTAELTSEVLSQKIGEAVIFCRLQCGNETSIKPILFMR